MDLVYQILIHQIDLIAFGALAVIGVVFCQLIMRSAQPGARIPLRNLLGTFLVACLCVLSSLGLSRVFEHRQIELLNAFANSANAEASPHFATLSKLPNSPELTTLSARWKTAFPGLQRTLVSQGTTERSVLFDTGFDYDKSGTIDLPAEQPLKYGSALDAALTPHTSGGWKIAPFLRVVNGHHVLVAGAEGNPSVLLVFWASDWCDTLIATRLLVMVGGLAIVLLLLSRPCLECVHNAELQRRVKVEASLQQAKEAADAESRMKGELMAVLTHEIRTPLTAIMGFSRVLLDSELDTVQHRHVETIVSAGDRVAGILNDILDLTKMEEGKLTLDQFDHSPVSILNEIVDLMTPRATKKRIALRLETPLRESFIVKGDPTRLRQIILRLLDNAIKYTEKGSVAVRLQWKLNPSDPAQGSLSIGIQDTGPGISGDRIPKLFNSLRADANARRFEGSGISLVMAKRLTELMGGALTVESTLGVGSTFTLTLPCAPSATNVATVAPFDQTNTVPQVVRRALVVDDQALNREIVRLMLQRLGYLADTAVSGQDAISKVKTESYDVIIMDIDMPDLDGYATTKEIRAVSIDRRHVTIIAVTGLTEKGTREKCLAAGMDEYLTKPVYAPALKSTLEAVSKVHKA